MKNIKKHQAVWLIRQLAEKDGIANANELHLQSGAGVSYPRTKRLWDKGKGAFSAEELVRYANFFQVPITKLIKPFPSAKTKI